MSDRTLYVSDLDGTLLGCDSLVSAQSAEIITNLTGRGAMITVATARTPATVVPLLDRVTTTPPAIVMTGAALWSRGEAKFSDANFIPAPDREIISRICKDHGLTPFVYTMDSESFLSVYHSSQTLSRAEQKFYDDRRHLTLKRFLLHSQAPADSQIILCYAMGPRQQVYAAADDLKAASDVAFSCYLDIFNHEMAHLEVFAPGVSKAAAVSALKERCGADRLVVFGDNLNDLPMLGVADCAVAVANAFDEVKEKADIVIGPNSDDSVARFILEDFEKFNG